MKSALCRILSRWQINHPLCLILSVEVINEPPYVQYCQWRWQINHPMSNTVSGGDKWTTLCPILSVEVTNDPKHRDRYSIRHDTAGNNGNTSKLNEKSWINNIFEIQVDIESFWINSMTLIFYPHVLKTKYSDPGENITLFVRRANNVNSRKLITNLFTYNINIF